MPGEIIFLLGKRREIPVPVQPGFTQSDNAGIFRQPHDDVPISAACFGRVSWNGAVNSSGPQLTINFPLAFTAPPQVFLAPVVAGLKVFAVVESVTNVQASITVCHLTPDAPASLNNVKWQNNSLAVDVAWLALGTM